ncbi:Ig-like domain-containing protein [Croceicoccus naphthovorans]|nr:Ig-like domain-containing protein [Croceicoccus naphthovorans]MBB3991084.1 hypothetical protein [Croceicoccus naphthovorans]
MRNTIATLLVLGSLTACGGGGSDGNRAPVVTLTAKATAESGEIVPLTVSVSDDKDANLDYTLSCTGGSLTGTLLTVPDVTANTTIDCTASATDSGGKKASAKVTITVQPATATVEAMLGSQTIRAGGIGYLAADGINLDAATYQATFNGQAIEVIPVGNGLLAYAVPVGTTAGTGTLDITIGNRQFSVPISVNAAIAVPDARTKVATFANEMRQLINSYLATPTINANDKSRLEADLATLNTAQANLATANDADVAQLASFLAANGLISVGQTTQAWRYIPVNYTPTSGDCLTKVAPLYFGPLLVLSVTAGFAGKIAPALGIAGIGSVGLGLGALTAAFIYATANWENYANICLQQTAALAPFEDLQVNGARPLTIAVSEQAFRPKTSRTFRITRTHSPAPAIAAQAFKVQSLIDTAIATLSFLPANLIDGLEQIQMAKTVTVPTSRISLGSVSGGNASGSLTAVDAEVFKLTFDAPQPASGTEVDFTFLINRSQEEALSVPGKLLFDLPKAIDSAVEVVQGRSGSAQVVSEGADTHEVVTGPAHGTLNLTADGSFTYTPSGTYFGTDKFTFRALNEDGYSNTATVMINVVRKFDGVWQVSTTSTTTSESSPNLCPNEAQSFATSVTKLSDTQYQTVYSGITIPFSMGSKDDPNGLVGSKTVTYDDDPGETTESITIRIPDSNHLSGSGSWSYSGPNGTFCSGTTSVTGTR